MNDQEKDNLIRELSAKITSLRSFLSDSENRSVNISIRVAKALNEEWETPPATQRLVWMIGELKAERDTYRTACEAMWIGLAPPWVTDRYQVLDRRGACVFYGSDDSDACRIVENTNAAYKLWKATKGSE